jgi:23S rRNA (adenine2503-C2)-methyltransferase
MKVVGKAGNPDVAMVYVMDFGGKLVECVEAVQPPIPREEKWVLMISTLYGCPIACQICDAGGYYEGKVTAEEMLQQINYLIGTRYPDGRVPSEQFKIQLARMGEPALNMAVLDLLEHLPERVDAPGLMPSLSTIAPHGRDEFFDRLIEIKESIYPGGQFQFQFSVHTTDQELRDQLLPVKKWDFSQLSEFGRRYYRPGDRKITLNFALADSSPVEVDVLQKYFDPELFLIKITPLNPTYQAEQHQLVSYVGEKTHPSSDPLLDAIREAGYRVILSIGELEENEIGSNCGQYVQRHLKADRPLGAGYTYQVENKVR